MKKIINYFLLLIPWFIFIFLIYYSKNLNIINYILLFTIGLINILISYTIINIFPKSHCYYKIVLIINYIINQIFLSYLFYLNNKMTLFISSVALFIRSLYLYESSYTIDSKIAKFLIPYIVFSLFFSFYMLIMVFINT